MKGKETMFKKTDNGIKLCILCFIIPLAVFLFIALFLHWCKFGYPN